MTDETILQTTTVELEDVAFSLGSIFGRLDDVEQSFITVDALKTDLAEFKMDQRRMATDLSSRLARIDARLTPDNDPRRTERD